MSSPGAAGSNTGGLFAAIDAKDTATFVSYLTEVAKDTATFVSYLTEDAVFRFGSAPPVQGSDAIRAAVNGFFSTIAGCRHTIRNSLRSGSTLFCEGDVVYRRHDGSQISLPFVDVFEYDGELIAHYKIYIDIGPLYAT